MSVCERERDLVCKGEWEILCVCVRERKRDLVCKRERESEWERERDFVCEGDQNRIS